MAARDKDRMGSTVALHSGETIPREYHRRILKKIAQLTKVIYNLNTKIDEHENFVANLRTIHETENKRILEESSTQLKRCEESLETEKKSLERQIDKLRQALEETRGERDILYDTQVSYRKEVEDQLSVLKSQHTSKVQSLVKELENFQSKQAEQLKQISDLSNKFALKTSEEVKALKLQHEEELAKVRQNCEYEIQQLQDDIKSLKLGHATEIDSLTKQFQLQLEAQSKSLASVQEDKLSQERQAWVDKEKTLNTAFLEKEEQLKQQISSLSKELRASNDKLALAEQRNRDLQASNEENRTGSGTLKALLEKSEADIECLRATISTLTADLDIAKDKYKQQAAELKGMSGTVAKLEALRVSNEGLIEKLHSQVASLQDKLKLLQEERAGLETSQHSLQENQAATIKALEREVEKLRREKQELHAQCAREVEAAHAQLSQRESELENEHLRSLRELQDEHSKVLSDALEEKRASLDNLRLQLLSQKEQELHELQDLHATDLSKLRAELADKTSQLELATEELKNLRDKLLREEQGLGSATSQLDKLRAELGQSQSALLALQREGADIKTENAQLKSTVESLRRQRQELDRAHSEELKQTRADLTTELEVVWKDRVKRETSILRSELSKRHSEETQVALSELASLKDSALRQTQENWERERRGLTERIESLEHELNQLRQATSASIELAKSSSDSQIESLRKELESEILSNKQALASLQRAHHEKVESIRAQHEEEKNSLTTQLKEQHSKELLAQQQTNQLAVNTLRGKMESEKQESLALANAEHHQQLKLLEGRLGSQFDAELSKTREEHLVEIEKFRQQIENVVSQSQQQMNTQEAIADSLRKEIENRDAQLSMLRDKSNSLTVALADLKKQLTVTEQELQLAKREAKTTLRIREQQLIATHNSELESVNAQHRHKAQQLFSDFNKAKSLLSTKIHELERQLSEWEQRYRNRDSKPEDLEAIRELRKIVRDQEQKMKDLVAEKRVYQLELMNREKNYNKLFNVNPQVGVLNPLQSKQRKHVVASENQTQKYASAPSLLAPLSPEPPMVNHPIPHSHSHLAPLPHSLKLAALQDHTGLTSSSNQLSRTSHVSQSSLESKPQKLVMLRESPLTQKRGFGSKQSEPSRKAVGSHSAPLQPVETRPQAAVSPQKHSMVVQ